MKLGSALAYQIRKRYESEMVRLRVDVLDDVSKALRGTHKAEDSGMIP